MHCHSRFSLELFHVGHSTHFSSVELVLNVCAWKKIVSTSLLQCVPYRAGKLYVVTELLHHGNQLFSHLPLTFLVLALLSPKILIALALHVQITQPTAASLPDT